MKKYVFGILFFGMLIALTGCLEDEDSYSLSKMWVGFGTIEEMNVDPLDYKITLDNGDVLLPVASDYYHGWYYSGTADEHSRLKTGDRILINYTILDDEMDDQGEVEYYYIKVNSVRKILKKGILDITEENKDSIGNDPIIVKDVWMTDSLLNFEIKYWGRYKTHYINLVKQPKESMESDLHYELELRHNANDDVTDIPFVAFVSFDLEALKITGADSVSFRVSSTDYDGEAFEYDGGFSYENN